MSDYYSVLGISRDATLDEVRKAFIDLAKKKHPDVQSDNEDRNDATQVFAHMTVAYRTLKDPDKRREYDYKLSSGLTEMDDMKKNHARSTFKLGQRAYKSNYYRQSYSYFQACCRLDPGNPQYWSYLGLASICAGRPLDEAKTYGEKAIGLHPSSPQYYVNMGLIYQKAGKKSDAKKQFKAALKIDPRNLQAKELMTR
jgi:curved DNA-binding protein CbpA